MASTKTNLQELIAKLPATDKEIEAQKAAAQPARDLQASKFTGPDPSLAAAMCRQVLDGAPDSINDLVELIQDPAAPAFQSYKPEYLLHCVTLYVGQPDRRPQRQAFAQTLAARVTEAGRPLHTRKFLLRELQSVGGREVVPTLGRLLTDEQLCEAAVAALVAIQDGAAEELLKALPDTRGQCRLHVLQAIGVQNVPQGAKALLQAMADADENVRLVAAWGIARLGDAEAVGPLLKMADSAKGFERIKATHACVLMAESLSAAGNKAQAAAIYTHLRRTRTNPSEKYIQDLAEKALSQMDNKVL